VEQIVYLYSFAPSFFLVFLLEDAMKNLEVNASFEKLTLHRKFIERGNKKLNDLLVVSKFKGKPNSIGISQANKTKFNVDGWPIKPCKHCGEKIRLIKTKWGWSPFEITRSERHRCGRKSKSVKAVQGGLPSLGRKR
jgi:hypothetical protein